MYEIIVFFLLRMSLNIKLIYCVKKIGIEAVNMKR